METETLDLKKAGREDRPKSPTKQVSYKTHKTEASIWNDIKKRCYNKKCWAYKYYGLRGVTVDERWLGKMGFRNFVEDMGRRPPGHTLDRIESSGNYCKSNCRWATWEVQNNNKSSIVKFEVDGEMLSLAQVSRKHKVNINYLKRGLSKGMGIKEALFRTPTRAFTKKPDPQKVIDCHKTGMSIYAVSKKFGVTHKVIKRLIDINSQQKQKT